MLNGRRMNGMSRLHVHDGAVPEEELLGGEGDLEVASGDSQWVRSEAFLSSCQLVHFWWN